MNKQTKPNYKVHSRPDIFYFSYTKEDQVNAQILRGSQKVWTIYANKLEDRNGIRKILHECKVLAGLGK